MFEKVCFVDYYKFPVVDAVGLALSTLATVLEKSLVDAAAASQALRGQPTLLILDNLETLQPQPLRELLDVAKQWSEVGDSRVLLTTRMLDFAHPDYPTEGSLRHRSLPLGGLDKEDALAYFQKLMEFPPAPQFDPPERNVLERLFKLVDFHPLSIGLLARQLKVRRPAELGQRLEALIAETPDNPLLASLNLSLERLDAEAHQWLPRLGVFQGGAMEHILLMITEFSEEQWQKLRPALESTGLIQPEILPGIRYPYLKFHPTLAPALWSRLSSEEQTELLASHRKKYYRLSAFLYDEDTPNPYETRVLAQRELPNLLYAVSGALDTGEEWAVDFVDKVNRFLYVFGLNRDYDKLSQMLEKVNGQIGDQTWYLARSTVGDQLFYSGRYQEAGRVFNEVLAGLGEQPTYERCITLGCLGRCLRQQGQTTQAVELYCQGLAELKQLEASERSKDLKGNLLGDLGSALMDKHDYPQAQIAYEDALTIAREQKDSRSIAVTEQQLGTLALMQNNLPEAAQRYNKARTIFNKLKEPESEASVLHQLGRVYEKANQWDEAEQAYREAAQIYDSLGKHKELAGTCHQLAIITKRVGKPETAEAWYRKAIEILKSAEDWLEASKSLNNLVNLLSDQPNRLQEARRIAEEALAIKQTLDPTVAKLWNIYHILANIADKQGDSTQAKDYRRRWLIAVVVAAVGDVEVRNQLESELEEWLRNGNNFAVAIQWILEGERDEDVLCEQLDFEEAPIINAILRGIADPETLKLLLEGQEE
jgi:tetratricopeptide (TPR) repeat protein